jgi:hypothetical protein
MRSLLLTVRQMVFAGLGTVILGAGTGCSRDQSSSPPQDAAERLKKEAEIHKKMHEHEAHNK